MTPAIDSSHHGLRPSDAYDAPVLPDTGQLGLRGERHVLEFIQEQSAAIRAFDGRQFAFVNQKATKCIDGTRPSPLCQLEDNGQNLKGHVGRRIESAARVARRF